MVYWDSAAAENPPFFTDPTKRFQWTRLSTLFVALLGLVASVITGVVVVAEQSQPGALSDGWVAVTPVLLFMVPTLLLGVGALTYLHHCLASNLASIGEQKLGMANHHWSILILLTLFLAMGLPQAIRRVTLGGGSPSAALALAAGIVLVITLYVPLSFRTFWRRLDQHRASMPMSFWFAWCAAISAWTLFFAGILLTALVMFTLAAFLGSIALFFAIFFFRALERQYHSFWDRLAAGAEQPTPAAETG